MKIPSM